MKIKAKEIKTRDYLIVSLISGATKSGVALDKRKEKSRNACRKSKGDRNEY